MSGQTLEEKAAVWIVRLVKFIVGTYVIVGLSISYSVTFDPLPHTLFYGASAISKLVGMMGIFAVWIGFGLVCTFPFIPEGDTEPDIKEDDEDEEEDVTTEPPSDTGPEPDQGLTYTPDPEPKIEETHYDNRWDVIAACMERLEMKHLTGKQLSRLYDQIKTVRGYMFNKNSEVAFDIRVNGFTANISPSSSFGRITICKPDEVIYARQEPEAELGVELEVKEPYALGYPDDLPETTRIKPAYYLEIDSSILLDEFEPLAREIEERAGYPDWVKYAVELHRYVAAEIETRPDKPDPDKVQDPRKMVEYRAGDIGSQVTLLASLYKAVGIPAKVVISHGENLDHDWRPVLFIKTPEIPEEIVIEKIHEYYTEQFGYENEDMRPICGHDSDLHSGVDANWILADPETAAIGENPPSINQPDTSDQRCITVDGLYQVEEHQYIL